MAWIEKRVGKKATVWRVGYRTETGDKRVETWATATDARRRKKELEALIVTGTWADPRAGDELFASWAGRWLKRQRHVTDTTAELNRINIDRHLSPFFGLHTLSQIRVDDVERWMTASTGSASSKTQRLALLGRILQAAVDERLIVRNPTVGVKPPKIERTEPRFLTVAELFTLADSIDPRYKALVLVAGFGGLRFGELTELRRRNLTLDTMTVIVAGAQQRTAKGGLRSATTKTAGSIRSLQLPQAIRPALETHLASLDTGPDAFVFPSPTGQVLRSSTFRTRYWIPATKTAGLDGLTPHDLRHTAASLAIAAGADIKTVQHMLGHTVSRMTIDLYAHLLPGRTATVAAALDRLISEHQPKHSP
jgi:integrase